MLRSPVASLAAIVTLALGIGGTTAVFSVADGVLLDPLPFPDSERLVLVNETTADGGQTLFSYENFIDLAAESRTTELALWISNSVAVTGLGEPERIRGEFVSASYFDVLGLQPALGRTIAPGEDRPGGDRTAVLAHRYWERRFGSDPGIVGRTLELNNVEHTIVGVMPETSRSYWDDTEAWISLQTAPRRFDRGSHGFVGLGRLGPGTDVGTADAELDEIMRRLGEAYPETNAGSGAHVRDLATWVVGSDRRTLILSLLGAIGLVLLIATANVANLQLARAAERSREMAVRSALGGGRRRLLTQLLVENGVLAGVGGLLGIGVAAVALQGIRATFPFQDFQIALNPTALGVALTLTAGTGILAGLWPAIRASSVQPGRSLRTSERAGGATPGAGRVRSGLVVAQMAMAVTLLVGASLLIRTTQQLAGLDVGFDRSSLLTGETRLTAEAYQTPEAQITFMDQVVERIQRIPGSSGGTLISGMPFSGDGGSIPIRTEGSELSWEQAPTAFVPQVAPGYFGFMGIPLTAGRTFERSDDRSSPLVTVISQSVAERLYPGVDPVGRRLETPDGSARIIGVVGDVRRSLAGELEPTIYISYRQFPNDIFSILIRTEGDPARYERALKEAFWEVDSNQPLWEVLPLEARIESGMGEELFLSRLLGAFSILALALAGVGIYGVIAYTVSRRRREMGIRLALGADGSRIRSLVLRKGIVIASLGVLAGMGLAYGVSRLLQSLIFGISATDPVSYFVAGAGVVAVALLATWIPALRATRVDPTVALKEQ